MSVALRVLTLKWSVYIQYEVGSDFCPVDNVEDSDLCPVDNVEDAIEYDRRSTTREETSTTENENDTLRFSIYEKPQHGVPNKAKIQKSIRFHHHSLGARYQPFDRGRYSVFCCPTMDFQSSPQAIFQASRLAFATLTVLRMVRGSIGAIHVYCRFYGSTAFQCVVQGWIFRTEARKRLDAAFVLQSYCRHALPPKNRFKHSTKATRFCCTLSVTLLISLSSRAVWCKDGKLVNLQIILKISGASLLQRKFRKHGDV